MINRIDHELIELAMQHEEYFDSRISNPPKPSETIIIRQETPLDPDPEIFESIYRRRELFFVIRQNLSTGELEEATLTKEKYWYPVSLVRLSEGDEDLLQKYGLSSLRNPYDPIAEYFLEQEVA